MNLSELARRAQIEKFHARRLNRLRQRRWAGKHQDALIFETWLPICGQNQPRKRHGWPSRDLTMVRERT